MSRTCLGLEHDATQVIVRGSHIIEYRDCSKCFLEEDIGRRHQDGVLGDN